MIFLSASIPLEDRDIKYFGTADIIAIRDAVRALATIVVPKTTLVWGGHPAITPLIRAVVESMDGNISDHVTLYQSRFFEQWFPEDNFSFENVKLTERKASRSESLSFMRQQMIEESAFLAGVFIGGMEGVEEEYSLFREIHTNALLLPVASTGAAAKLIYEASNPKPDTRLENDYAYMSLFRSYLSEFI